ncbi:RidA family protein [Egibacter rhizosphaerae]|uniref:RidA family protein n=1 Tax=Egibacter rhizosphaerae TaxID=1670831 RepID=A0A411YIF2_9ACTN|nr:RidA family protein [Egibacter rhizosphaerae]QBI20852.1 RidA family protein [Egibacter rhizosphaerae]
MDTRRSWSGSPWEERAGYCRAVRVDDRAWVAGTAPFADDGSVVAPGDMAAQTRRCLEILTQGLADVGAEPGHVVATRMYVTDITLAGELSEPHREAFGGNPPAATLVQVAALVHPDVLIEVEAEAVVRDR